jgi:hypothetical protein
MKNFLLLALLMLCSLPMIAQEDDEDEKDRREYSYWNRTKIGGSGGVTPIVGMFDNVEIDKFLTSAGMPTLGTDPLYLIGGEGHAYIMFLKNVRMGGFGAAGGKTVSAIQPITGGGSLRKEVDYKVSYGGFLIDYVQPVAYRLDVSIGASIGGGEMSFTMRRDNGNFKDWTTEWNDFGNPNSSAIGYTKKLTGTFVVFTPRVNIEYTLLTWLQLRIGAGYPVMYSPEWKLDDQYEVNAVPSKIKLNGYTINAGIMFGYFGW